MANPWIETLRERGFSDDEIVEILSSSAEEEETTPPPQRERAGSPRTISGWKSRARQLEEEVETLRQQQAQYEIASQFEDIVATLPEDLQPFVSVEDLTALPEISPVSVRVLAQTNYDGAIAELEVEAREYGYPNVDAYLQAHEKLAEMAQQYQEKVDENNQQMAAQSGFALDAAPATVNSGVLAQAAEASAAGDVDRVQELIRSNPRAFSRRLNEEFRPE